MCNDEFIIYQGGICMPCGKIWSVQRQDYIHCWDEEGSYSYCMPDGVCQWPNGHPTGQILGPKIGAYISGDLTNVLQGFCIRCISEREWDSFKVLAEMEEDTELCPQAFVDKLQDEAPEELDEDAKMNGWWDRPYQLKVQQEWWLPMIKYRDPQGMEHSIRQFEGPLKFWHHRFIMIDQERVRLNDPYGQYDNDLTDLDLIDQLVPIFDSHAHYYDHQRMNDEYHSHFGKWEGHPEQPYRHTGFPTEDEVREGIPLGLEDSIDPDAYLNLDAPSGHIRPPEPAPPSQMGMEEFLTRAGYEDYSYRNV